MKVAGCYHSFDSLFFNTNLPNYSNSMKAAGCYHSFDSFFQHESFELY